MDVPVELGATREVRIETGEEDGGQPWRKVRVDELVE